MQPRARRRGARATAASPATEAIGGACGPRPRAGPLQPRPRATTSASGMASRALGDTRFCSVVVRVSRPATWASRRRWAVVASGSAPPAPAAPRPARTTTRPKQSRPVGRAATRADECDGRLRVAVARVERELGPARVHPGDLAHLADLLGAAVLRAEVYLRRQQLLRGATLVPAAGHKRRSRFDPRRVRVQPQALDHLPFFCGRPAGPMLLCIASRSPGPQKPRRRFDLGATGALERPLVEARRGRQDVVDGGPLVAVRRGEGGARAGLRAEREVHDLADLGAVHLVRARSHRWQPAGHGSHDPVGQPSRQWCR